MNPVFDWMKTCSAWGRRSSIQAMMRAAGFAIVVAVAHDRVQVHHAPPFAAIFDNSAAISRSLPCAACW